MTMFDVIRNLVKPTEVDVKELLGMSGLAERNQIRMAGIKRDMGDKWILHPSHKCGKLHTPRPV